MCPALVEGLLSGFNTTLLAYGQTSSGKTHTLMGTPTDPGLIILMIDDVFSKVVNAEVSEHLIRVSYFEIYNENFVDLLAFDEDEEQNASASQSLDPSERGRADSMKYDPQKEGNKFDRLPSEESNAKLRLRGSTKTGWHGTPLVRMFSRSRVSAWRAASSSSHPSPHASARLAEPPCLMIPICRTSGGHQGARGEGCGRSGAAAG